MADLEEHRSSTSVSDFLASGVIVYDRKGMYPQESARCTF